jgi:hypothetical protein|tara:strand:+ start:408 stop:590 length:183 start_codon:yes stop_codon:yes gene_type:complete
VIKRSIWYVDLFVARGFDKDKNAYYCAPPTITKFLSRVLGKRVNIKNGLKSGEKLIKTYK